MPYRDDRVADATICHLYNRGVNRQQIFFEVRNYVFFRSRIASYFSVQGLKTLAYCLMLNHYHLLVAVEDALALPKAMHGLQMSYSKAVNRVYRRSGPLFQGPYSLRTVSTSEDLLHLSRYVHLNPVRSGIVREPEDWPHSSYRTYVGWEDAQWISTDLILETLAPDDARDAQMSRYREFVQLEIANEPLTPGAPLLHPERKEKS
ncbi:MAG: transposase [Anaerolineales bacterium]